MATQEEVKQFIDTVAAGLGEKPDTPAYQQIVRSVAVFSPKKVVSLAHKALEIFNGAGMWTIDKKRKRSLGGCFFILVKRECTDLQFKQIFGRERKKFNLKEVRKVQKSRKPSSSGKSNFRPKEGVIAKIEARRS